MSDICIAENAIKEWVKSDLTYFRIPHWPITAGFGSTQGIADRLAVGPGGIFCAFECKRGVFHKRSGWQHPTASDNQLRFLEGVTKAGGFALVVGPREGCKLREILMERFPSLWSEKNIQDAKAVRERRGKKLQAIVERGF